MALLRILAVMAATTLLFTGRIAAQERETFTDADGQPTLINPDFKVPALAEIDAKAGWVERRVIDGLRHYADYLAKQPPALSTAEALKLKNTSLENNAKLLAAFARLPDAKQPADFNAIINRRMKGDVNSVNPILVNTIEEFDLQSLLGFSLFSFDWDMQPFAVTEYVKSWHTSADGMMDKVVMRDDMTWSDGKPITAADVVFSFKLLMNPKVPALALRSQAEEIRWIEAYDNRTLIYFHKRPLVTNVWNLSFSVLPQHIYKESVKTDPKLKESAAHRELERNPVVGGPYIIEKRVEQQEILLKRRDDWYLVNGREVRDKPFFKQIRFRIVPDPNTALLSLKRADIDELELNMQQWQKQTDDDDFYQHNTKVRANEWTFYYFGWNNRSPYFNDKRVRQAMSYAFDLNELIRVQNYGLTEPCLGPYHPTSWMFPKNAGLKAYRQDLERADELLADAGWEDTDDDGVLDKVINGKKTPFDFILICVNDPVRIEACSLMKNCLAKLGIKVTVRPMELVSLVEKTNKHEFDAYFGGWGTGTDPDTSENIWTTKAIDDGRNYICYSNRQVDGLFELGKQTAENTAAREAIIKQYELGKVGITAAVTRPEIYGKINELIYADQAGTFAYYRSAFFGFNNQLRGYKISPRGPYHFTPGFGSIWKHVP